MKIVILFAIAASASASCTDLLDHAGVRGNWSEGIARELPSVAALLCQGRVPC